MALDQQELNEQLFRALLEWGKISKLFDETMYSLVDGIRASIDQNLQELGEAYFIAHPSITNTSYAVFLIGPNQVGAYELTVCVGSGDIGEFRSKHGYEIMSGLLERNLINDETDDLGLHGSPG